MSEKMLQPVQAELVFNSSKYAMDNSKSFKEKQAIVKAYQQGYRDHKDRSDQQLQELIGAMIDYEKTRIEYRGFSQLVKAKETKLLNLIEKIRAEYETNI